MINVRKVREGEQINVSCCSHDELVVVWLFCIKQKTEPPAFSEENKLKWVDTKWEIYLL